MVTTKKIETNKEQFIGNKPIHNAYEHPQTQRNNSKECCNTWTNHYPILLPQLIWQAPEIVFSKIRSLFKIPLYLWFQFALPMRIAALGCCVQAGRKAAALLMGSCHRPHFSLLSDHHRKPEDKQIHVESLKQDSRLLCWIVLTNEYLPPMATPSNKKK